MFLPSKLILKYFKENMTGQSNFFQNDTEQAKSENELLKMKLSRIEENK